MHGDDESDGWLFAGAAVGMRGSGVEVHAVSGLERVGALAVFDFHLTLQHIQEFVAGMHVRANFGSGCDRQKFGVIGIELPLGHHPRQALKIVRGVVDAGLGKAHALAAPMQPKQWVRLWFKEIGKVPAKDHGDAGEIAQRGHHAPCFQLGEEAGGKTGEPAELHQAHGPLEAQAPDALADALLCYEGLSRVCGFWRSVKMGGSRFKMVRHDFPEEHRLNFCDERSYQSVSQITRNFDVVNIKKRLAEVSGGSSSCPALLPVRCNLLCLRRMTAAKNAIGWRIMKSAAWSLAASGLAILLAGCGLAANPQPPTLWLPQPVKNLTAVRSGDQVELHWTMPRHTTDQVELKGPQRAHVCWVDGLKTAQRLDARLCHGDGDGEFAPDKPAAFTAQMPAELKTGTPRGISFFVELENRAGKTAGPSNPAWIATGTAPPAVSDLHLEAQASGVVVHWRPAAPEPGMVMRLHRTLVIQPKAPKPSEESGAPAPQEQTLEVDLSSSDAGGALDRDAPLDHLWRYTAQRVLKVSVDGHTLAIAGVASAPVTIDAKDVFPPAVPAGLTAVVDEQAKAIDLSWTPDTAADLEGYVVYRSDVTSGSGWERISGAAPVVPPSFEDRNVLPGRRYAYAVSAVDRDGNESARSGAVEEELPQ